jgi:hypothetical protein
LGFEELGSQLSIELAQAGGALGIGGDQQR